MDDRVWFHSLPVGIVEDSLNCVADVFAFASIDAYVVCTKNINARDFVIGMETIFDANFLQLSVFVKPIAELFGTGSGGI